MVDAALRPFSREPSLASHHVHRDLAFLVLAVAAFALPFLAQPFHMDDSFYLDMARNALSSPLFPNDTPYVFQGAVLRDMGSHSHPPLHTYFLALVLRLAGEGPGREWIFHLFALIYPVAAVAAFYFIAAAFVERPLWPALVLAAAPLFMVMQHTLMTDVPTLAWWLAAIAFFLRGTERQSAPLLAASALCQFGAMFTSYQSVALTPLLAFYQLRRRGRRFGWIALAAPLCLMAAWFGINYVHYGRFLLTDTAGYMASRNPLSVRVLWIKLITVLQYQGWLIVFPLFFIYLSGRVLRGRFTAALAILSAYLTQLTVPNYRPVDKLIFAVGLVAGITVLSYAATLTARAFRYPERTGFGNVEAQFLALWYMGVLAYCLVLFTEGSARYVLPLVPPVLICFFRYLELTEAAEYRYRPKPLLSAAMIASGSLVVSLGWGLLLSHADLEFARVYPRAAGEFARISEGMKSFCAGEWGFRYYFHRAGVQQLPVDESKVTGANWLVRPKLALPYDIPAALWTMGVPVQTLSYDVRTPLRILDWHSPAGFYSSSWGLVPFSISRDSLEMLEVRQVNYMVERLPWARVRSDTEVGPWPGFVEIQGTSPLAVLAHPDTRISYTWEAGQPLSLEVKLGVGPGSYSEGENNPVTFRVLQRASDGEVLGQQEKVLNPGMVGEHRRWHPCRLLLQNRVGSVLEFGVSAANRKSAVTAAFAHAVLSPVR